MVTASHNPVTYNGMKFVRQGARPISGDSGLKELEQLVAADSLSSKNNLIGRGHIEQLDNRPSYIAHLLGYVDPDELKPLKLVVNAGNGGAGQVVDLLEKQLPFSFIKIQYEPDGTFPNGVPMSLKASRQDRLVTIPFYM